MDGWMDGSAGGWVDGWVSDSQFMGGYVDKRADRIIHRWTNEWLERHTYRINIYTDRKKCRKTNR